MDGLICLRALWDRVAAWAFIIGGGLLVLDAGRQARDAVYAADSFSFLTSGGIVGLAAIAVGGTLLVSAGFHDEWRKLHRIEAGLARRALVAGEPAPPAGMGRWLRAEADRVLGWALVAGAAVWLAVGSRLVAGALYAPKQVTYVVSGGVSALVLLLAGLAVLLTADTRDEEHKLERIDALIRPGVGGHRDAIAPAEPLIAFRPPSVAGLALGALFLVMGWWRAAGALRVERAMDGLALAAAGAGVVTAVLVLDLALRRSRLTRRAGEVLGGITVAAPGPVRVHTNGADSGRWTAAGLERFHVAACPVLAGIESGRRTPVAVGSGLEPCLLCDAGVTRDA